MAKQAARRARGQPAKKDGTPLPAKIFLFACAMPPLAVLFPSCIVIGLGMTPTLGLYIFDRVRERSFAVTVGLTNCCGLLPGLGELWMRGHTSANAMIVVLDPLFWLFTTAAAGIGWLIYMGMPPLIAVYYNMASEARIKTLLEQRRTLIETWGEEVDGDDTSSSSQAAPEEAEPV